MNLNEFGINWNKPATKLIESVEVIKELWKTAQSKKLTVNYSGEFFNLKNVHLQCRIKNLPKLWMAANGPRLLEFTGKVADGWIPAGVNAKLYKKNLKILGKAGRIDEIEKACEVYVIISKDNPDIARQWGRKGSLSLGVNPYILEEYNVKVPEEYYGHYFKNTLTEMKESEEKIMEFAQENVPQEVADSMVIFGSPEECIEQIEEYIKAGVEHFLIEIYGIGKYFQVLELFTDTVFSNFKEKEQ